MHRRLPNRFRGRAIDAERANDTDPSLSQNGVVADMCRDRTIAEPKRTGRSTFRCGVRAAAVLWWAWGTTANGQTQPQPFFEVASVKPVEGIRGRLYDFSSSGPRVRYLGYTVAELIREAYNVRSDQVAFAPSISPP